MFYFDKVVAFILLIQICPTQISAAAKEKIDSNGPSKADTRDLFWILRNSRNDLEKQKKALMILKTKEIDLKEIMSFDSRDSGEPEYHTLLSLAVTEGQEVILNTLLESGADVNQIIHNLRNDKSITALQVAAKLSSTEITKALIEAKANVNVQNKFGNTALHAAVKRSHIPIVRLLLNAGASFNIANGREKTAIKLVSDLKARCDVDSADFKNLSEIEGLIEETRDKRIAAAIDAVSKTIYINKSLAKIIIEYSNFER